MAPMAWSARRSCVDAVIPTSATSLMTVLAPTRLRFCITAVVLDFEKAQEAKDAYDKKQGQ